MSSAYSSKFQPPVAAVVIGDYPSKTVVQAAEQTNLSAHEHCLTMSAARRLHQHAADQEHDFSLDFTRQGD